MRDYTMCSYSGIGARMEAIEKTEAASAGNADGLLTITLHHQGDR